MPNYEHESSSKSASTFKHVGLHLDKYLWGDYYNTLRAPNAVAGDFRILTLGYFITLGCGFYFVAEANRNLV